MPPAARVARRHGSSGRHHAARRSHGADRGLPAAVGRHDPHVPAADAVGNPAHPPTPFARGSVTVLIGGRRRCGWATCRLRLADRDRRPDGAHRRLNPGPPCRADAKAFLGTRLGVSRRRLDVRGECRRSSYEEDIRQAIRIILGDAPGERVMRPDFGAGLHALVFEPINTHDDGAREAPRRGGAHDLGAAHRSGRRSTVTDGGAGWAGSMIDIRYRVRATNTFYNLVYPFYLLEGEQTHD